MVDVVMKTPEEIMNARIERVRNMSKVDNVLVEPIDGEGFTAEGMRELLVHPKGGAFRPDGPALWPNDTFTFRRLKEGSVRLVEQKDNGKRRVESAGRSEGTS